MERRHARGALLGGGAWGTTVAWSGARSGPRVLWARAPEVAEEVGRRGRNSRYLGDFPLTDGLRATDSLAQAVQDADVLVMGVPSHGFRGVLEQVVSQVRRWIRAVSLVKGLEQVTSHRMTEIVAEVLPGHPAGVLAGPNVAKEVMAGYAAAATIAMPDQNLAARLADLFRTSRFRIYSTTDVMGVEIAGALKNIFAIAAGMADGAGAGYNTKAMVITRAVRGMRRVGDEPTLRHPSDLAAHEGRSARCDVGGCRRPDAAAPAPSAPGAGGHSGDTLVRRRGRNAVGATAWRRRHLAGVATGIAAAGA